MSFRDWFPTQVRLFKLLICKLKLDCFDLNMSYAYLDRQLFIALKLLKMFDSHFISCKVFTTLLNVLCNIISINFQSELTDRLSGEHHWYSSTHSRPTFCNVCGELLSGISGKGLSCEGELKTLSSHVFWITSCQQDLLLLKWMMFSANQQLCSYLILSGSHNQIARHQKAADGLKTLFNLSVCLTFQCRCLSYIQNEGRPCK